MIDIITWFQTNWKEIIEVISMIIAIASAIVRWTPTLKDDNFLLPIIKFLGKYIALDRSVDDDAKRAQ
jgi:hypothetical protein